MRHCCSFLMLLGRICISIIFIISGLWKFFDYSHAAAYMASKGMTMIPLFLYLAAIIEVLGGLAILLGYKTRWASLILALYLIPVTVIFHDFWNLEGMGRQLQMMMFLKNLAIFGGLLYIASSGAGGCSCDACFCKKCEEEKKHV